jgi:hypothetical protein
MAASAILEYRELSVERVADICRVTIEDIEALERGAKEYEKWLFHRFVRACGAHLEYEVLVQKLLEFNNPLGRESAREVAKTLLPEWGMIIPGVDYKNLNSQRGKVVPLFSPKKESNDAPSGVIPPRK